MTCSNHGFRGRPCTTDTPKSPVRARHRSRAGRNVDPHGGGPDVILGIIYPLVIIGVAQVLFNHQANGSLMTVNGRSSAPSLIGQNFTRPSTSGPGFRRPRRLQRLGIGRIQPRPHQQGADRAHQADVAAWSGGSWLNYVRCRSDMVTTSGSGLDPDIRPAYAYRRWRGWRRPGFDRGGRAETGQTEHRRAPVRRARRATCECIGVEHRIGQLSKGR